MKRFFPLLCVILLGLLAPRSQAQFSLANTSTLVTLPPGGSASIGFVVKGTVPNSNLAPTVMIRAVGRTLLDFGVTNPVRAPQFTVVGPNGVPGGNAIFSLYPFDWNATFANAGAFPLTGNEQNIGAVRFYSMPAGAYSVQVSDATGQGGAVLLEVYINVNIVTVPGGPS